MIMWEMRLKIIENGQRRIVQKKIDPFIFWVNFNTRIEITYINIKYYKL
jgi:hypothetical protein